MENAVAIKEAQEISVADVKKYIAPNATDKELFMFMGVARSYGLNPMKREIHFVKYGNSAASIIVGYETYLKRAERTGKLDGWKCWIEDVGKPSERAVIEIKRKDQSMPITWEVYRKEFDKQQSSWKSMPTFMLKKVAIAQGFRMAFPDDLGGMPYIPEELPASEKVTSENLSKQDVDVADYEPADIEQSNDTPDTEPQKPAAKEAALITENQRKRFYAIAKGSGKSDEQIKQFLFDNIGSDKTSDIQKGVYEYLCNEVGKAA